MEPEEELMIAAQNGDPNKVKELIRRGVPVNTSLGVSYILERVILKSRLNLF